MNQINSFKLGTESSSTLLLFFYMFSFFFAILRERNYTSLKAKVSGVL